MMATHVVTAARYIQMQEGKRLRHFKGAEITLTGDEAKAAEDGSFVQKLDSNSAEATLVEPVRTVKSK